MPVIAAGLVTGGVAPVFVNFFGFSPTITRVGAGDYRFTLSSPQPTAADYVVTITPRTVGGASAVIATVEQTTGSLFETFTTNTAGVVTDADINIVVTSLP